MTYITKEKRPKAVLVSIPTPGETDSESKSSLEELGRLVTTLGFDVLSTLTQKRASQAGGTVLGEGKLLELAQLTGGTGKVKIGSIKRKSKAAEKFETDKSGKYSSVTKENIPNPYAESETLDSEDDAGENNSLATVIVFDCELTPSQLANVQSACGAEVLDRTGVIVEIFSRHAKTREAKLQVEIARLNYLSPRVRETGSSAGEDRTGTSGETSLELDKRRIRDRVAELKRELVDVQKEQTNRRSKRSEQLCVALVGYTNAGKSSLMRALTGSEVLVADKLFATLDTTVRSLFPESQPRILVSDTVGFIKKLPHDLVASFRSTLEEAANSRLLLYVVDASDPTFRTQLNVTKTVLAEIGVEHIPSKLVLNKIDNLNETQINLLLTEFPGAIALSARNPQHVMNLRNSIVEIFEEGMVEEELFVSYAAQGAVGSIRSNMRVLKERFEDDGMYILVRCKQAILAKYKKEFC
jgi:GTPase